VIVDFAFYLVLLIFLSGAICVYDSWRLAPRRAAALEALGSEGDPQLRDRRARVPAYVDYARSFLPIFVIVLLLRSFLIEPFRIPSGSMMPTLLVGDFIVVNKYIYGIRLPVVNRKLLPVAAPERGDVIVFRYPDDPSQPYIKRVVGLPGDRIRYENKVLYVNDEAVAQTEIGRYVGLGAGAGQTGDSLREEALPGRRHQILLSQRRPDMRPIPVNIEVPNGQYFVLGDNRDNSTDSRWWGFVPDHNLIGRAFMIWLNWDIRNAGWKRIGQSIN
jgi:signal peptidase I